MILVIACSVSAQERKDCPRCTVKNNINGEPIRCAPCPVNQAEGNVTYRLGRLIAIGKPISVECHPDPHTTMLLAITPKMDNVYLDTKNRNLVTDKGLVFCANYVLPKGFKEFEEDKTWTWVPDVLAVEEEVSEYMCYSREFWGCRREEVPKAPCILTEEDRKRGLWCSTWTTYKYYRYTCTDKTRILMHDEQSPARFWCHKVDFQ